MITLTLSDSFVTGAIEKVLFNRKVRKDVAKNAKPEHIISALCELCANLSGAKGFAPSAVNGF